jgi:hypothetical protein
MRSGAANQDPGHGSDGYPEHVEQAPEQARPAGPDEHDEERWTDWDAGPVSRPYALTGGRTRPRVELRFDLIDVVAWTGQQVDPHTISPEGRAILQMCQNPVTVADLASAIGLPLGVVRVLLGDLVHDGLVDVRVSAPKGPVTDQRLLARVLAGIRAL